MEPVTTRISEEDVALLAAFEAELGVDRPEALRRLVHDGLADWRHEGALEQLREQSVTVRRAAEIAGVEYVELLELAAEADVDVGGYAVEDLARDCNRA